MMTHMQLGIPRRRRAPTSRIALQIEEMTHRMVVDVLTLSVTPGWLWFHVPNGEKRGKATAGRLKAMGTKAGVSDLLLIAPGGARLHALELKRKGRKPTETQKAFMCAVVKAGGEADWADTFDDAIKILGAWGAVRVAS